MPKHFINWMKAEVIVAVNRDKTRWSYCSTHEYCRHDDTADNFGYLSW